MARILAARGDLPFAFELRAAIGAGRAGFVVFAIGTIERPVEDIVGREMQQRHLQFGGGFGDEARARAIDAHRDVGLALGLVDLRIGGGVDDGVAAHAAQRRENHVARGEIEARTAEREHFDASRRALDERADDLAGEPGDGDALHLAHFTRKPPPDRAAAAICDPCRTARRFRRRPATRSRGQDRPRRRRNHAAANRNSSPCR